MLLKEEIDLNVNALVRLPEPVRQSRAALRQRPSVFDCPRAQETVRSRSQTTAPMRVSCRETPPRSARRFTRAKMVSAITEVSGVPLISSRIFGVMLALQQRPPGMNSAA